MKKLLSIVAVILCLSFAAFAQDAKPKKEKPADGPKTSQLTGCLLSAGAGFTVTNGRHRDGVAVAGTSDLEKHVGHQVRMKGKWAEDKKSYKAESVTMVSDTCPATGAPKSSKKKAAEKQ